MGKLDNRSERIEADVMVRILKGRNTIKIMELFECKPWLLNSQDRKGRTCLHYAALFNDYDLCKFLIKKMVVNKRDKIGMTPYQLYLRNFVKDADAMLSEVTSLCGLLKWYEGFRGVDQ